MGVRIKYNHNDGNNNNINCSGHSVRVLQLFIGALLIKTCVCVQVSPDQRSFKQFINALRYYYKCINRKSNSR